MSSIFVTCQNVTHLRFILVGGSLTFVRMLNLIAVLPKKSQVAQVDLSGEPGVSSFAQVTDGENKWLTNTGPRSAA